MEPAGRPGLVPLSERRISDRAFVGHYLLAFAAGGVLAAILFVTAAPFAPLALAPPAGVFLYSRLMRLNSSYRLFGDRMEVESGILSRRIENVELFRVRDVGLRQGLLGRLLNFGDVYLHSTDSSQPDLHVRAVDSPRELYELVRSLISTSRAQNRTLIVEEGHPFPEG